MSKPIKELTLENFDEFISKKDCIVDFWAEWCNPCKVLAPKLEEAASKLKGVSFGKVNIESDGDISQRFGIMSIPTLLFFRKGNLADQTVGVLSASEIIAKAEELFS